MSELKSKHQKVSLYRVLTFGLRTVMTVVPGSFIVVNIVAVCRALMNGLSVFATQMAYDSVAEILTENEPLNRAVVFIILLGLVLMLRDIIEGLFVFMHSYIHIRFIGALTQKIHAKMAHIQPICMEDTKVHDDIEKASTGKGAVFFVYTMCVTVFSFYIPLFIFMGFYLHDLKPQFILAIVLVFIPVLLTNSIRTGIFANFEDKAAPIRREYEFYRNAIVGREYFKETRLLGGYSFF